MKFKFCGDADCPDWVLVEINTISRLSSVKLKLLCQIVAHGIISPPINMEKAEKLFIDSKLDAGINLQACVACLNYILSCTTRFNCDSSALQSELQQLGLPREHSTSIKKIVDDQIVGLTETFRTKSLKMNRLERCTAVADRDTGCATLYLTINGDSTSVTLTDHTVKMFLKNLQDVKKNMNQLKEIS